MKGIGFPNRLLKEGDGLRDRWMDGGETATWGVEESVREVRRQ